MLNFFYDEYMPFSCIQWGEEGNNRFPIIVNDGSYNNNENLMAQFVSGSLNVPNYLFINKNFEVHFSSNSPLTLIEITSTIEELLEE